MPIYEYECKTCGDRFDKFFRSVNRISDEVACPSCQSTTVQRLISAPAIRTGETGETGTEVVDSTTPSTPPVIGRKELKEAAEKKRQIKEQVQFEKKQQARKKR